MSNQKIPKIDLIPFKLNDLSDFIYGDFRSIDPVGNEQEYYRYWGGVMEKVINGNWGRDYDMKKNVGGYRWQSGNLWYYTNMFSIRLQESAIQKEAPLTRPRLRGFDWFFDYCAEEAVGFSGFEYDKHTTCNRLVGKIQYGIPLTHEEKIMFDMSADFLIGKNGKLKKYIRTREYLFQTFPEPLGNPLYHNPNMNYAYMTTRRLGKTYHGICRGQRGILTNGATSVDQYMAKSTNFVFVMGAFLETNTADDYVKFFEAWNELYNLGLFRNKITGEEYSNAFWIPFVGSQELGNWMSTRNKERGGQREVGANNLMSRFNFASKDSAMVGPAPSFFLGEEFGLWERAMGVYGKILPALTRNTQFASMFFGGTGGEVKKAAAIKPIHYNPAMINAISFYNYCKPGSPDTILFVPQYYRKTTYINELGNIDLDAAYEDALIEREDHRKKGLQAYIEHTSQFPMIDDDIYSQESTGILPLDIALERKAQLPPIEKRFYAVGKIERMGKTRSVRFKSTDVLPIVKKEDLKKATAFQKSGIHSIFEPPKPGNVYLTVYDSIKDMEEGSSMAISSTFKLFGDRNLRLNAVAESIFRLPDLNDSDDVFINQMLYYNSIGWPETNVANVIQRLKDLSMLDLIAPFPMKATNMMVKQTKGKYPWGYYIYPNMKKLYLARWVNTYLTTKIDGDISESMDQEVENANNVSEEEFQNFSYDGTPISETLSEYMLDDVIDYTGANADYLSVLFGLQIYIKDLIANKKFYHEPSTVPDQSFKQIMNAFASLQKNAVKHNAFKGR